jgi:hypothetical protein
MGYGGSSPIQKKRNNDTEPPEPYPPTEVPQLEKGTLPNPIPLITTGTSSLPRKSSRSLEILRLFTEHIINQHQQEQI